MESDVKNEENIQEKVLGLIYETIDELNEDSDDDINVEKKPDTVLLGPESCLDSLKLVNLIVEIEQKVEDEYGFAISAIANEKAMSRKVSPLRNIITLAEFITSIIEELKK